MLDLKKEEVGYLDFEHPYDAMLDRYGPGATTKRLRIMFDELKTEIVLLVLTSQPGWRRPRCTAKGQQRVEEVGIRPVETAMRDQNAPRSACSVSDPGPERVFQLAGLFHALTQVNSVG